MYEYFMLCIKPSSDVPHYYKQEEYKEYPDGFLLFLKGQEAEMARRLHEAYTSAYNAISQTYEYGTAAYWPRSEMLDQCRRHAEQNLANRFQYDEDFAKTNAYIDACKILENEAQTADGHKKPSVKVRVRCLRT